MIRGNEFLGRERGNEKKRYLEQWDQKTKTPEPLTLEPHHIPTERKTPKMTPAAFITGPAASADVLAAALLALLAGGLALKLYHRTRRNRSG